ncbi:MAG: YkgJ family cysteine cluster protein [Candidatus Bathyarchaeota archaeon]|nr:YkgJ family cysteine cluster protein [Candidatus Bathyarchaeota archaeon]
MEITVKMLNLDLSGNIAEAALNPKTKCITKMTFHQKHLRFRCQRCATFCCKLGGPKLTQRDIERIKQAGYDMEDFLKPLSNNEFKGLSVMRGSLKNRENGSCVFLKFDEEKGIFECSIYDVRPDLCRLYPFDFEKVGPYSFVLKLIPCCKGLNAPHGELANEEFVTTHLLCAILNLMIECNMPVKKRLCAQRM